MPPALIPLSVLYPSSIPRTGEQVVSVAQRRQPRHCHRVVGLRPPSGTSHQVSCGRRSAGIRATIAAGASITALCAGRGDYQVIATCQARRTWRRRLTRRSWSLRWLLEVDPKGSLLQGYTENLLDG